MTSTRMIRQFLIVSLCLAFQWMEAQCEKNPQQNQQQNDKFMVVDGLPILAIDAQVISRKTCLAVSGLTHKDFIISANGIKQDIVIWEQRSVPLSLPILIDPVGSNGTSSTIENQLQALKSSLAQLTAKDEVSLILIADRPIVLQDFTGDKDLIRAAIDMASQYRTAVTQSSEKRLLATLEEAAKRTREEAAKRTRAGHDPEARKAIVLLSNMAEATAGRIVFRENLVRTMVESSSILCATRSWPVIGNSSEREEQLFDRVSIAGLVRLTGGEVVGSEWNAFIERLRERHRMGYVPLAHGKRGTRELVKINLELAPAPGRNRSDFRLIYPSAAVTPASN